MIFARASLLALLLSIWASLAMPQPFAQPGPDYGAWENLAAVAETTVTQQDASNQQLEALRAAEEADTERWFSESLESSGRTSAESVGRTAEESPKKWLRGALNWKRRLPVSKARCRSLKRLFCVPIA